MSKKKLLEVVLLVLSALLTSTKTIGEKDKTPHPNHETEQVP